jgi:hypothetical protein
MHWQQPATAPHNDRESGGVIARRTEAEASGVVPCEPKDDLVAFDTVNSVIRHQLDLHRGKRVPQRLQCSRRNKGSFAHDAFQTIGHAMNDMGVESRAGHSHEMINAAIRKYCAANGNTPDAKVRETLRCRNDFQRGFDMTAKNVGSPTRKQGQTRSMGAIGNYVACYLSGHLTDSSITAARNQYVELLDDAVARHRARAGFRMRLLDLNPPALALKRLCRLVDQLLPSHGLPAGNRIPNEQRTHL